MYKVGTWITNGEVKLFEPQSIEWLETRKKYVTATEASSILGLDKYQTASKVYRGKIEEVQVIDNIFMRAGRFLEPAIIADLNNYGIPAAPAHPTATVMVIDKKTGLSSSLDGIAEWNNTKYIVECKTTSGTDKDEGRSKFEVWNDKIPMKYYVQVQVQMGVTGVHQALLVCVEAVIPFPIIGWEITFDKELYESLGKEVERFWKTFQGGAKRFVSNTNLQNRVLKTWDKHATLILS